MNRSTLDPISVSAIESDIQLINRIVFDPSFFELRPIFLMGASPYLALVLKEAIDRIGLQFEQIGIGREAESRFRATRNEVKVLAHPAPIDTQFSEARRLISAYTSAFDELHSDRRFARLWRRMQPHMGLFFRNGEFVTNTFTLHQDVGLTTKQARIAVSDDAVIGQLLKAEMSEYGQALRAVAGALNIQLATAYPIRNEVANQVEGFRYRDVKSSRWLSESQKRLGTPALPVVYLILNVLSRIRTAAQFAELYAPDHLWTQLKIKLIYAFHDIESIRKLVSFDVANPNLSDEARTDIRSLLGMPSSKSVVTMRGLRNFTVHYDLDSKTSSDLSGEADFTTLVASTTEFSSIQGVVDVLDENLAGMTNILSNYFDLGVAKTRVL